jgi:hypothetical protein
MPGFQFTRKGSTGFQPNTTGAGKKKKVVLQRTFGPAKLYQPGAAPSANQNAYTGEAQTFVDQVPIEEWDRSTVDQPLTEATVGSVMAAGAPGKPNYLKYILIGGAALAAVYFLFLRKRG